MYWKKQVLLSRPGKIQQLAQWARAKFGTIFGKAYGKSTSALVSAIIYQCIYN